MVQVVNADERIVVDVMLNMNESIDVIIRCAVKPLIYLILNESALSFISYLDDICYFYRL